MFCSQGRVSCLCYIKMTETFNTHFLALNKEPFKNINFPFAGINLFCYIKNSMQTQHEIPFKMQNDAVCGSSQRTIAFMIQCTSNLLYLT